jgi:hypothetical protein
MKFCKHLQQMMNISDPEWVPYYTNYKMLKKLIKELKQPTSNNNNNNNYVMKEQQQQHEPEYEPEYDHVLQEQQTKVPLVIVINDSNKSSDYQTNVKSINNNNNNTNSTTEEEQQRRQLLVEDVLNQHNTKRFIAPPPPPLVRPVQREQQLPQQQQQQETGELVTEQRINRNQTPTSTTTKNQNVGESSGIGGCTTKNDSSNGSSRSSKSSSSKATNTTIGTTTQTIIANKANDKIAATSTGNVVGQSDESMKNVPFKKIVQTVTTTTTTTTPSNMISKVVAATGTIDTSSSPLHKKQCCKQQIEQQQQQQCQQQQRQQSQDDSGTTKNNPMMNELLFYNNIKNNTMEQYFFRCLHTEVKKVSHFYHLMIQELYIRYERIYQSTLRIHHNNNNDTATITNMNNEPKQQVKKQASKSNPSVGTKASKSIKNMNNSNVAQCIRDEVATTTTTTTGTDRWNMNQNQTQQQLQQYVIPMLLISIYKLSRDLLLLESYSIMAFTSFSKILKKHDKVTGYDTKYNFMTKIVIPSNFVQTNTSTYINHTNMNQQQHRIGRNQQLIQEPVNDVSMNRKKAASKATRTMERIGNRENQQELPSLQTMIEQCYHWYGTISEQYERNETPITTTTIIQQPQQQPQQPKALNYDEMLFLNMIQQLNQNYR